MLGTITRRNGKRDEAVGVPPGARSEIIRAEGLSKAYDTGKLRVEALRGVDLAIPAGQMVAIMGPSGCGKTTLLNVLSGIDDLSAGEVYIAGRPLHRMSDKVRTRFRAEQMGFVFQSYNLMPVLSAVENVELPLLVAGVGQKQARRRALDALALVNLSGQASQRPAELSGGQQQRVTIARSLVNRPAIVWADEPTGALDSETSGELMDLLVRLNEEEGQTFVVVTHDPTVAARAHRIVLMRDGRIERDAPNERRAAGGA